MLIPPEISSAPYTSGIGRLLFSHLLSYLRRPEVIRLMIASDPNAAGFYQRLGAGRIGAVSSTPRGRRLPRLVFRLRPSRRSNNTLAAHAPAPVSSWPSAARGAPLNVRSLGGVRDAGS